MKASPTLLAAALLAFAPGHVVLAARQTSPVQVRAPIRRASFDLETGRSRVGGVESTVGREVIYDNTCLSAGYFGFQLALRSSGATGGTEAEAVIDEGGIPTPGFQGNPICSTGCRYAYEVSAFEIAYCTSTGAPVDLVLRFWDPPDGGPRPCGNPYPASPTHAVTLSGLPRARAPGVKACYVVTVDLGRRGSFHLEGSESDLDKFAWSFQVPSTTGEDGPLLGGDSNNLLCPPCGGTVFDPAMSPGPATGFGNEGSYLLERFDGSSAFCSFRGFPHKGIYLELSSDDACPIATSFCDGADGALSSCPCNPGQQGHPDSGCDNSAATGGVRIEVIDQDTVGMAGTMQGVGYPPMGSPTAVLIRSNDVEAAPVVFGDGLRCVGLPGFVRLAATTATGGASTHVFGHGAGQGLYRYQVWYRNSASFCSPDGFNLSNGQALQW